MIKEDRKDNDMADEEDFEYGIPLEEQEFMDRDIDGYIEWKIKEYEKAGINLDELASSSEDICTYYTPEEVEESRKRAIEELKKMEEFDVLIESRRNDADFDYDKIWRN